MIPCYTVAARLIWQKSRAAPAGGDDNVAQLAAQLSEEAGCAVRWAASCALVHSYLFLFGWGYGDGLGNLTTLFTEIIACCRSFVLRENNNFLAVFPGKMCGTDDISVLNQSDFKQR